MRSKEILLGLFLVVCIAYSASALSCYDFLTNSYDSYGRDNELVKCDQNLTMCATIQYSAVLQDDGDAKGETVKYQEGRCTVAATCHDFCRILRSELPEKVTQCQVSCCNSEQCNNARHNKK